MGASIKKVGSEGPKGWGAKKNLAILWGKNDEIISYHIISYHKYYPLSIIHIISYNIIIHFVPWFFFGVFPCFRPPKIKKDAASRRLSKQQMREARREARERWCFLCSFCQPTMTTYYNLPQLVVLKYLKIMLIHTDLELRMQVGLVRKMRASSFQRATWEDIRRIQMDWNRRAPEIV